MTARGRDGSGAWWWPAGTENMTPRERVAALNRGWWMDGDAIVTSEGRRYELVRGRAPYRTGADRARCSCGVWVYTESIDGRAFRWPQVCWRCGNRLHSPVMPGRSSPEASPADRERGA